MDYVIGGNVMLDTVRFADGTTHARESIGGPATFAYSGVKLWTDSVLQCSRVGRDYHNLFDAWVEKNSVETKGFKEVCECCNHSRLVYFKDGTYGADDKFTASFGPDKSYQRAVFSERSQDMGYMKTSPSDLGEFTKAGGVKGVYMAQNCDSVFWDQIGALKARDGFQVMWEIEATSAYPPCLDRVRYACRYADIFSINLQEAQSLFGIEKETACIRELQKLPVDMILFRVGERGLYTVTPDKCYYLPPAPTDRFVDPTGCGNTSTGAALYAYTQGCDPLMTGIMANCASAQNIRQFGVIEDFKAAREQAYDQAEKLYEHYKNEYEE